MFLWNSAAPYFARESPEKSTNCSPWVILSVIFLMAKPAFLICPNFCDIFLVDFFAMNFC